jgi:hypothetical protein
MRRLVRYWKRFCLLLWSLLNTLRLLDRLLEESLLVGVVLNGCTVDVDGPYVEGVDRLDTSYKGRSVGRVSLWDASISDAIGTFPPCGTAVVWPFRLGMVVCLFDVECFLLKSFFWRVSKSFWRLHLYGWRCFYFSISFKCIFSNFVVYWAVRSKWGLIITWLFPTQKRNGSEL